MVIDFIEDMKNGDETNKAKARHKNHHRSNLQARSVIGVEPEQVASAVATAIGMVSSIIGEWTGRKLLFQHHWVGMKCPGQQPELDSTTPSLQCTLLHCNVLQHSDSWLVLLPWRLAAARIFKIQICWTTKFISAL